MTYYNTTTKSLHWKKDNSLVSLDSDGYRSFYEGKCAQDRVWECTQWKLPPGFSVWPQDLNPWNLDLANLYYRKPGQTGYQPTQHPRFVYVSWHVANYGWELQIPDYKTTYVWGTLREAITRRDEILKELGKPLFSNWRPSWRPPVNAKGSDSTS